MSDCRLVAAPEADSDIEAAFEWYEKEQAGLGIEFLDQLRITYDQIADGPLKYPRLRLNTRRALLKRFPYAVYFAVENEIVVVLAFYTRVATQQSRSDVQDSLLPQWSRIEIAFQSVL